METEKTETLEQFVQNMAPIYVNGEELRTEAGKRNGETWHLPDAEFMARYTAALNAVNFTGKAEGEAPAKSTGKRLNLSLVESILNENHWSVCYDLIAKNLSFDGKTWNGRKLASLDDLTEMIKELCVNSNITGATRENIENLLGFVARENPRNRVLDYLQTLQRKGDGYINNLLHFMGIEDKDRLSASLVRKWLYQCVCLLYNSLEAPIQAEGILVLQGAQGIGKTSLFRRLALKPEFFLEGSKLDEWDRDTFRRAISVWICELGELDASLKRVDPARLKTFATQAVDVFRLPYGRHDIAGARLTSMGATLNPGNFLVDQTGNRRFWVVPLKKTMPYREIQEFDAEALWAEVFGEVCRMDPVERASCFRLTPEEFDELTERNKGFMAPVTAQSEIADILSDDESKAGWNWQTATQFKESFPALKRYAAVTIGRALVALGVESRRRKNTSVEYFLPQHLSEGIPWDGTIQRD